MKPSYYTQWNEMGHKKELFILSISKPDPLIKSQSYPNITENNSKLKKKKSFNTHLRKPWWKSKM